jgi:hypothetical protein
VDNSRLERLVHHGGMLADAAPEPELIADNLLVAGLIGAVCLILVAAAVTVVVLVLRRRR